MFFAPSSVTNQEKNTILSKFLRKDPSIWTDDQEIQKKISNRLGWMDVKNHWKEWISQCNDFVNYLKSEGFQNLILLGMGGSSLCPIVLNEIFGSRDGFFNLFVVDTTDPDEVDRVSKLNPSETFVIVASKSGTTIEPNTKFNYLWELYRNELKDKASKHFGVITDPSSSLEGIARERGFPFIFLNPPDIGGRYSALSLFGLVSACCLGIDMELFLDRAGIMIDSCLNEMEWSKNPGARLSEFLGENSVKNRDKLTILTDKEIKPFGLWLEQLIAESTGKETRGLVPIVECSTGIPGYYGSERIFVYFRMKSTPESETLNDFIRELKKADFPVYEIELNDIYDIGGQFFLWEFATALSCVFIGVNPFDEPNVVLSKNKTKEVIDTLKERDSLQVEFVVDPSSQLNFRVSAVMSQSKSGLFRSLREIFQFLPQWGYMGFLPYLPYNQEVEEIINNMRDLSKRERGFATVMGYGPRYLHSTGQLFKGGPLSSAFLIFTRAKEDKRDYQQIPSFGITFWQLQMAQAIGDFEAMSHLNKRVIHVHLPADYVEGLRNFSKVFERAIMIG